MALDTLLASLAHEAEEEAAGLVRSARERRSRALAEAEVAASAARATRLRAHERELAARAVLATENERRGALRRELEARAEALDRVLRRAAERLPALLGERRVHELLACVVRDALAEHGEASATVRAAPALVGVLTERLGIRAVVVADASVGSGARLVLHEGSFEVDATLEAQLARLHPRLTADLARELAEDLP